MLFENKFLNIYRNNLFVRNDNPRGIFYFTPEDFPGLQAHPYSFTARAGHTLNGFFYHYPGWKSGRVLVFDHGMGNGHRAYMKELERLAKAGFLVFAYDHTGCMTSGGDGCNGFAQSLSDLDACLDALKREKTLEGYSFSVMGHSWGGFSAMNICALHPDITHVVAVSGFVSVQKMQEQFFSGVLKLYRKAVLALERQVNGDYVDFDAVESLKGTQAKVLLIHSANDKMVHKQIHWDLLVRELEDRENIQFRLEYGKGHNPHYTEAAVEYKNDFFAELEAFQKRQSSPSDEERSRFMKKFDWHRMTQQDDEVWKAIIDHLNEA